MEQSAIIITPFDSIINPIDRADAYQNFPHKKFRYSFLHLLLTQWQINNQFSSLIQILYAQKPKNPV